MYKNTTETNKKLRIENFNRRLFINQTKAKSPLRKNIKITKNMIATNEKKPKQINISCV